MRLPRLRSALWLLPGMVLGLVLLTAFPPDTPPRPVHEGDVEAEVWAAALQHLAHRKAGVEVLGATLPHRPDREFGGVDLSRAPGPAWTPLLRAHVAGAHPLRRVGEALVLRGRYGLVPADSVSREALDAWMRQRDAGRPIRVDLPWARPGGLVILGRASVSSNGRLAVLETESYCGSWCGYGELLFLRRGEGGWKVAASTDLWFS